MNKVVFDTNFLLEKRMKRFFCNQSELRRFSKKADIFIPDMVIEELKARYKRDFKKEKDKFFKTLLTNVLNHDANAVDIDDKINALILDEETAYQVIELTDPNFLFEIKQLAVAKEPPFVGTDGSDKGFKDAYIYFTTLEFLQGIKDKQIFFVTDDALLKQAFDKHPNVIVINGYDEFIKGITSRFSDAYFLSKLQEDVNPGIRTSSIVDYWVNIVDNDVLLLKVDSINYIVEVDSGEIVFHSDTSVYIEEIQKFINSASFEEALLAAERLSAYLNCLSDEEIIKILEGALRNSNIYEMIQEIVVKQLISTLYEKKKSLLSDEQIIDIDKMLVQG